MFYKSCFREILTTWKWLKLAIQYLYLTIAKNPSNRLFSHQILVAMPTLALQVTALSQLASTVNHSVDYGQVDVIGIIITVVSSHITTANGSVNY